MRMQDEAADAAAVVVTDGVEAPAEAEANVVLSDMQAAWGALSDGDVTAGDAMLVWSAVGWPIAKAIILIIVVFLLANWVGRMISGMTKKAKVEVTLARFFGNLARWAILILGGITILQTFGVEATSFAAVVAAVGFAIGMAMSGTIGNVAAGVMLLIFRPFKVGDVVNAAGTLGVIDEIGLFTTTFDTFDKRRIIVPNGKIFGDTIENITYHPVRRFEVSVGTVYSADVDATRAVLQKVVTSVEGAEADPAPQVFLSDLGDNSVNWKLRVWAKGPVYWDVYQRCVRDAKKALDEAGIGIPFPQRDVHVPKGITVRVENK